MFLCERQAKKMFDDGAEPDSWQSRDARAEFGIDEPARVKTNFGKARQVLTRRVKNPGVAF